LGHFDRLSARFCSKPTLFARGGGWRICVRDGDGVLIRLFLFIIIFDFSSAADGTSPLGVGWQAVIVGGWARIVVFVFCLFLAWLLNYLLAIGFGSWPSLLSKVQSARIGVSEEEKYYRSDPVLAYVLCMRLMQFCSWPALCGVGRVVGYAG
jgi:hypothetical protein